MWGQLSLHSLRHASILAFASAIEANQFAFGHSSRSEPLEDSIRALSVGVPDREKSIRSYLAPALSSL